MIQKYLLQLLKNFMFFGMIKYQKLEVHYGNEYDLLEK